MNFEGLFSTPWRLSTHPTSLLCAQEETGMVQYNASRAELYEPNFLKLVFLAVLKILWLYRLLPLAISDYPLESKMRVFPNVFFL